MRRFVILACLVVLPVAGCATSDGEQAAVQKLFDMPDPIKGNRFQPTQGAWSVSDRAREIERSLGYH